MFGVVVLDLMDSHVWIIFVNIEEKFIEKLFPLRLLKAHLMLLLVLLLLGLLLHHRHHQHSRQGKNRNTNILLHNLAQFLNLIVFDMFDMFFATE